MTFRTISTTLSALLFVAGSSAAFAQDATTPGKDGTAPLTQKSGVGRDSKGGGPSSNGTADGSGTATGGNPSGYPDKN